MNPSARWRPVALAAAAVVILPVAVAAAAPPGADRTAMGSEAHGSAVETSSLSAGEVTLITGDVVRFTERQRGWPEIAVEKAPRPDGRQVDLVTQRSGDDYYVIPSDAQSYVDSDVLDRELFNVTGLIEQGYADTKVDATPVIVTYRGGMRAASRLPSLEGATRQLPVVNGTATKVSHDGSDDFWARLSGTQPQAGTTTRATLSAGVATVHLDRKMHLALDESVPQIGAPEAWQEGYDGTGVKVAVLDSGVDATHPDLAGQVVEAKSFVPYEQDPTDLAGHGTHVASTIAGTGAASGGKYRGVAPGASLISGKVCSQYGTCALSWMLEGMDWAARSGARVINMSIGGEASDGSDLLSEAVDDLTAETGTLFVVAAGNDGENLMVNTPGTADAALTVGAVDGNDDMAEFSSRGPRLGDGGTKPDIVAPGVAITAARASQAFPDVPADVKYVGLSGTSMATPHVAGAAAIAAQLRPDARATQLKAALTSSAVDTGAKWYEQGSGRVEVPAALDALRGVSGPSGVSLGRLESGSAPATGTLSYRNNSQSPVTLQLAYDPKGWDGRDGTASLSASELTVPANSSADVTVTVDPDSQDPGAYGGVVTATDAGGTTLRTPVSWYTPSPPPAQHQVTVRVLDSFGQPVDARESQRDLYVLRDEAPSADTPNDPFTPNTSMYFAEPTASGDWVADVPEGTYSVFYTLDEMQPKRHRVTLLSTTDVDISAASSVTLDAREAVPSRADVGSPTYRYDNQTEIYAFGGNAALVMGYAAGPMEDLEINATPVDPPAKGAVKIQQQFTLGSRFVEMKVRGQTLDTLFDPYLTTRDLAGKRSLQLVSAGQGTPEEFAAANVRGKAALVRLATPTASDPLAWTNAARDLSLTAAANAAAAGAALVVPYFDKPGALPVPAPFAQGPSTTVPLPIMSIGNADGERLQKQPGKTQLQLDIQKNPADMYALNYAPDDGVPATLARHVDKRQLKHTRSRFHADVPGLGLFLWWWGYRYDDRISSSTNPYLYLQAPAEIDHYVGPMTPNQRWRRTSMLLDKGDGRFQQEDERGYRTPVEDWFAGPLAATSPESQDQGFAGYMRIDDDWLYSTPFLTDSSQGHYTSVDWGAYPFEHRLFQKTLQGEKEIAAEGSPVPSFHLSSQRASYRMESTFELPDADWQAPSRLVRRMSPKVTTTWTFDSARPTDFNCLRPSEELCEVMPLLQLRYDLGLDLQNRARAGQRHDIGVTVSPSYGAIAGGQVSDLAVDYSTDGGQTWQKAQVTKGGDGRFQAALRHPRLANTDGYIWLRTSATDSRGNTVQQVVHRAYRLN